MITFEIIGNRIKSRREDLNMNQKDLAEHMMAKGMKISRETISKIENGSRATNALEIKVIAEILSVSAEGLMADEEEKDLVSLFRNKKKNLSEEAAEELDEIQDYIRSLIAQKELYKS